MSDFPSYVRDYIAAYRAAHGREPTFTRRGAWWEVADGPIRLKWQKGDLVRATIILEGRVARGEVTK